MGYQDALLVRVCVPWRAKEKNIIWILRPWSFGCVLVALRALGAFGFDQRQSGACRFLLVGGTGQIGKGVAQHLLLKCPNAELTLTGRSIDKSRAALKELSALYPTRDLSRQLKVLHVNDAWSILSSAREHDEWRMSIQQADVVIHTAGPYAGESPTFLEALLQMKIGPNSTSCKVYVDVSDPLTYLDAVLRFDSLARARGLTAMVAAGAFPGMSNVLAMEAASFPSQASVVPCKVRDLCFQYFIAGLGGSGEINLYITNLGFGDDMAQFHHGKLQRSRDLSGRLLGTVDFGPLVGSKRVFFWPFPEAATVASDL